MSYLLHAYHSEQAASCFGNVFYRGQDGRRVAVTIVVRRRRGVRRKYTWDDLRYVGRVWADKILGVDEIVQAEMDLDWEIDREFERERREEEMQRLR